MNLIYSHAEHWPQKDLISHVADCARVCYASESTSRNSDEKLIKGLETRKHTSMFRHESRYFIIAKHECPVYNQICAELNKYKYCPYISYKIVYGTIYISTNGDFYRNNKYKKLLDFIWSYQVTSTVFENTEVGYTMMRYTICVVTQISTSRELNRTSPNNIAEQSTRYVNFGKKGGITICLPHWWDEASAFKRILHRCYWKSCELMYNLLLKIGFKPEDARGVLPLDAATQVIYTYTIDEWRHILALRLYGTTGKPHPNAVDVAMDIARALELAGQNVDEELCK